MHLSSFLIHSMKGPVRHRILSGGMVTVVGELLTGRDPRSFPDNAITLHYKQAPVLMADNPFAPKQGHRVRTPVPDSDVIDKGVRLVQGQAQPAMVMAEPVKAGLEAGKFLGGLFQGQGQ